MGFKNSRILRITSTVVLAFFLWTFGGAFDIAYAIKNSDRLQAIGNQKKANADQKPEEKFQKTINDIEDILSAADTDVQKSKLKIKKSEIESLDIEIRKQFKETEEKIKDLPEEINQRHRDFVRKYEENLNTLIKNLDDIEKAKTKNEIEKAIDKTKSHLEKVKPPKKHVPLDPNKLPHRTAEPVFKEPRTSSDQFESEIETHKTKHNQKNPILLASNYLLNQTASDANLFAQNSVQVVQATNAPTSADLAETIEVQFTPEIKAKSQELGKNPVKIYNWVRNNIEFVSTYGSIQGANMCLQTKECNAFDTASLLIAILRASNIPARYVYGKIELPIEKVMNWVGGFTNANAAIEFISSGGIPVKGLTSGGKITSVRMEHVWVEAYVDYNPSRGARHKEGDTWIPLDASFKEYSYTQGIDIKSAVPFDSKAFIEHIQATATINETEGYVSNINSFYIQQQMADYQTRIQNYISQNFPNATVDSALGKKEIIKQEFPYLIGTLPYKRIVTGARYPNIPDRLRHKITFGVVKDIYDELIGTPINITRSLPELVGKKITLSYTPATSRDEAVINAYLPNGTIADISQLPTSLPAYLINLKPQLRIEGIVIATGTALGMGSKETFSMTFTAPNQSTDIVTNEIDAGEYLGIAINHGKITQGQILDLKTKLEVTRTKLTAKDFTNMTKDDILGDILYATALSYYAELDTMSYIQAKLIGIVSNRLPSEAIFSFELNIDYIFGLPRTVSSGGLSMDVDRNINMNKAINGDNDRKTQFILAIGINSSALEHAVPELLFSTPDDLAQGVSAVKALQIANDQGIPIYTINQTNINTVLPQLQVGGDVKADIQNAVNAGKEVTVSKKDITFNGWSGVGYIVIDPSTGAGAYMISGGMSGGWLSNQMLKNGIWILASIMSALAAIFSGFWVGLIFTILLAATVVTIQKLLVKDVTVSLKDVALYLTSVIAWTSVGSAFAPLLATGLSAAWVLLALLIIAVAGLDLVIMYSSREVEFLFVRSSFILNEINT